MVAIARNPRNCCKPSPVVEPCGECQEGTTPLSIKLIIEGLENGSQCDDCGSWNGEWTLTTDFLVPEGTNSNPCKFGSETISFCDGFHAGDYQVEVHLFELQIQVLFRNVTQGFSISSTFEKLLDNPIDCSGAYSDFTLILGGSFLCDWDTATITVGPSS